MSHLHTPSYQFPSSSCPGSDHIVINTEDPEYYAELFCKVPRVANWRVQSSWPGVPRSTQVADGLISRRLQSLLDAVANISLCRRGNVSATMASLKDHRGSTETQFYIVFNHENDDAAGRCSEHLQTVFNMLRRVPYIKSSTGGSRGPKIMPNELESDFIDICRAIHNYSFDIFVHRVLKRESKFPMIRRYIEQDQTHFTAAQRGTLLAFVKHVDSIIQIVRLASAHPTKPLSTKFIKILLWMYSYWTEHNLLPDDSLPDNKLTLLDAADTWMDDEHKLDFKLRRWALKIMSFLISSNKLFSLTQSNRLRKFIEGKFSVQVLPSPTTTPYECYLSSETIQETLNIALADTGHLFTDQDDKEEERKLFIGSIEKNLEVSDVVRRQKPTVHAELAMTMAIVRGEIKDVFSYIGVSKLSCIMCIQYIRAFNEVTKQKITTKGSHGKAYPGWFWPSHPDCDKELRQAFLKLNRQQLVEDFRMHVKTWQLSDSTVESSRGRWKIGDADEIDRLDDEVFKEMFQRN